jgi:hypothetical protein
MKLRRDLRMSLYFRFLYLAGAAIGFLFPVPALLMYAVIPAFFTVNRLLIAHHNRIA